jgi:hypothetical protein
MMFQNLPRSSSPISKDQNKTFVKDFPPGLSFPGDFLDETGDSTRSLLAPIYNNNEDPDREEKPRIRLFICYSFILDDVPI